MSTEDTKTVESLFSSKDTHKGHYERIVTEGTQASKKGGKGVRASGRKEESKGKSKAKEKGKEVVHNHPQKPSHPKETHIAMEVFDEIGETAVATAHFVGEVVATAGGLAKGAVDSGLVKASDLFSGDYVSAEKALSRADNALVFGVDAAETLGEDLPNVYEAARDVVDEVDDDVGLVSRVLHQLKDELFDTLGCSNAPLTPT